ncbi:MAG: chemotaxis protein CheC [bacterium]|nr:chemotaxis protein CheC [bacterium]
MENELNQDQKDALREIVSIGAGNAATALSQMLNKKINIEVPKVNFSTIEKAVELFGDAEALVIAIYLQLLGDATGVILFPFFKKDACKLVGLLLGRVKQTNVLSDMEQSALKETMTIISGAYLSAMAKLLKMKFLVSSPALAEDMAGAIIDNILIETSKEADHVILVETEFTVVDEKILANFFFIPDMLSLGKILNAMGVGTNAEGKSSN